MKAKWLRVGSLVVLLGLVAAIPASTQALFDSSGGVAEAGNLPLLVLVNRMELTPEQMEEIHGALEGLLEERRALELRWGELEQEMIAFAGTAEELDEILEAFRAEAAVQVEAARDRAEEAIDRIKGVLTLKQGEILREFLSRLLADRGGRAGGLWMLFGQQDEESELGPRERLLEQLEERFADSPRILELLQRRLAGSTASDFLARRTRRGDFRTPFDGRGRTTGRGLGDRGRLGLGSQQGLGGVGARIGAQRGLDWIEQLVEVLELKLEAIG